MELLDEVKQYLKIDDTEDDIESYISAAECYLTNAGVAKNEDNKLYCLAVKMLVTHWYDNRGVVVVGSISKSLEYSLRSIINQLKYCSPLPEVN